MDNRDKQTWVVVELTRAGEIRAEEGTLPAALRDALRVGKDHPVFLPYTVYERGGRKTSVHLMEGYVFVASGMSETHYFLLERDCPYVKRVLSATDPSGMRVLSTIPDSSIEEMRQKLKSHIATDLDVGMHVTVTEGIYGNLKAEVVALDEEEVAQVLIELRSIKIITSIPRIFLDPSNTFHSEDQNENVDENESEMGAFID